MKKIFVAAAILAMFAAVSCKSNEKKAEEATAAVEAQANEAAATLEDKAKAAAEGVAEKAIDAAADRAAEELVNALNK